jgi:hypothetical protein
MKKSKQIENIKILWLLCVLLIFIFFITINACNKPNDLYIRGYEDGRNSVLKESYQEYIKIPRYMGEDTIFVVKMEDSYKMHYLLFNYDSSFFDLKIKIWYKN